MDEYRRFVEESAVGEKPSSVLRNRSARHAAIIFENIFRTSQRDVKILTGTFNPSVYGVAEVVAEAISFLRRNGEAYVDILHEGDINFANHPWFSALSRAGLQHRIHVAKVSPDAQLRYDYHFCVSDSRNYRLELNKHSHEAIVQFRERSLPQQLEAAFEEIKKQSIKEELPKDGDVKCTQD